VFLSAFDPACPVEACDADPAAFTAFGYTIVGGRFARKVNTAPRLKP
jgi:hypothetical protein